MKVIAIIDIGKTNKKVLLFDESFQLVYENSTRFDEVLDEDGFPCDDIESIENWIQSEIKRIQKEGTYLIKAINFSTHGASIVFLGEDGKRLTPLYNYLKPLDVDLYSDLFDAYGGKDEFSRKTASPAYGMLNTGLQIIRVQQEKPEVWNKVAAVLHYPQYLSYLFTHQITADYTSIGAHTGTWDFDTMKYHDWLSDKNIKLPIPTNGKDALSSSVNSQMIAVGSGLHDSSSSIIPLLKEHNDREFVLLSTGTWIIAMNAFSEEKLTQEQLKNNCLCFMTPEKKQIKSSMQFLGRIHEVYLEPLALKFKTDIDTHLSLELDRDHCERSISENRRVFLSEGIDENFEANDSLLENFESYKDAYYQLMYEISKKVGTGINLVLDKNNSLVDIYISGGFNRNKMFVEFISQMNAHVSVKISDCKNESALGAALLMKEYL